MNIISIIPARMGSSRFPGKPMSKLLGMPMIGHCYHRTNLVSNLEKTYVATCDNNIKDYVMNRNLETSIGLVIAQVRISFFSLRFPTLCATIGVIVRPIFFRSLVSVASKGLCISNSSTVMSSRESALSSFPDS